MRTFSLVFNETAVAALRNLRGADSRAALAVLDRLRADPVAPPDAEGRSANQRPFQVKYVREFASHYWIDYLNGEIRVAEVLPRSQSNPRQP